MISVTLCNAVFISRSSLPVNEETEVSELKVAISSLSCHASSKWLVSLAHVYKAVVIGFSAKGSCNLSVSDFINDILGYLQEVRVRIFPYLLVHLATFL